MTIHAVEHFKICLTLVNYYTFYDLTPYVIIIDKISIYFASRHIGAIRIFITPTYTTNVRSAVVQWSIRSFSCSCQLV